MNNILKVLQDSVVSALEGGTKSSRFPSFHRYIEGSDDVEADKMPSLKEECSQIYQSFIEGMELTTDKVEVNVPVHATGYSPLFGVPVEKDARESIARTLDVLLDQCELAILANSGFGRFSASPDAIAEAQKRLRENVETIHVPSSSGINDLKMIVYDSNNNPKHKLLVDGLWVPYRTSGLLKHEDKTLAFMSTMDYKVGNWGIDQLDTDLLNDLAESSSLFPEAYKKLTGNEFNKANISRVDKDFINSLKSSPFFQRAVNRMCARWIW